MSEAFDPKRDHRITREEAAELVQVFRSKSKDGEHRSSTFNRSAFEHLLAQPDAVGIRIYRAQHPDGSPTMVMVAVNANGVDLDAKEAVFVQNSHDCPPICGGSRL